MNAYAALTKWFPDRTPTWIDIGIALLVSIWLVTDFFVLESISWESAAVGFILFAVAVGPVANSFVGRQVGDWFQSIGLLGRATIIILFAIGVWITGQTSDIPGRLVTSFTGGGMLAISLYVVLFVLYAGEVSGWRPD